MKQACDVFFVVRFWAKVSHGLVFAMGNRRACQMVELTRSRKMLSTEYGFAGGLHVVRGHLSLSFSNWVEMAHEFLSCGFFCIVTQHVAFRTVGEFFPVCVEVMSRGVLVLFLRVVFLAPRPRFVCASAMLLDERLFSRETQRGGLLAG